MSPAFGSTCPYCNTTSSLEVSVSCKCTCAHSTEGICDDCVADVIANLRSDASVQFSDIASHHTVQGTQPPPEVREELERMVNAAQ